MKLTNPFGSQEAVKEFCKNNNLKYLGIFGSFARGEQGPDSDIDFLIKIDHSKGKFSLFDLIGLQHQLENRFNRKVDLVTGVNKYVQPYVEKDLTTLYEER